jgi:uncharacterized protein (DUF2062 family)
MFIAVFVNNPWTMVPMATGSAYVGNLLLGRGLNLNLSGIHWHKISWRSFVTYDGFHAMCAMLKPIFVPYVVGGLVCSLLALPLGYWVMLKVAQRLRKTHLHLPHLHIPHLHHDKSK